MTLNEIMLGAIAMGAIIAGLFFFRFWKSTGDRFFLFFSISFELEGINRIVLGLTGAFREDLPEYYLVRLISYALILVAILDKNRPPVADKDQSPGH